MIELNNICQRVIELSKRAGAYLVEERDKIQSSDIETKGAHDYVTYVDKTCEELIVKGLAEILPEAGFIVEENTSDKKGDRYNWIVDPLDGTTNYIHGLSPFCTSIALQDENEIVLGVIFEPMLNECFYAWKGSGAFLNSQQIKVSDKDILDHSLLATGFPYSDYKLLENYIDLFRWVMLNTQGVRRLGSAAVDMAYVACGRMDGFFEYGLKPWDVAAGAIIVKEAGGIVSDFTEGDNWLFGQELLAFNPKIHKQFCDQLKKHF
jgi:myo-inositol-1(or 4)-monophosphatase